METGNDPGFGEAEGKPGILVEGIILPASSIEFLRGATSIRAAAETNQEEISKP
jgi:hypothetical protein